MGKLKKMGIAGRFRTSYGNSIKYRWKDVMDKLKSEQKCPKCHTKLRNMRLFVGVWQCRKCGAKFTGGAWTTETTKGKDSKRIIQSILETNK
jgi:large subunit ribosomal protein L37Ae